MAGGAGGPFIRGHPLSAAAAFVAWAGAAAIVLADGRRGLALGLGLIAVGLGVATWTVAGWPPALLLLIGGGIAAARRLRSGPPGWMFMPPGSTPRLILSIFGGLIALWIAAVVTSGGSAEIRYAALVVIGTMVARILLGKEPAMIFTAATGIALAAAAASSLSPTDPGIAPFAIAALIAVGAAFLPAASPRGA